MSTLKMEKTNGHIVTKVSHLIPNGHCKSDASDTLVLFVNGVKIEEPQPDPSMTLLTYMRERLRLTGTKLACGEGGCGACTVMVSRYEAENDNITHFSVNACIYPLCSMHGSAVTTVEGIGNLNNLHPVQERIAKFHGSQCGFCTPGMVMSMYTLLRNNPEPSYHEVTEHFDGNLCRCTGYRAILDGFRSFTKEFKCAMGAQCCQNTQNGSDTEAGKKSSNMAAIKEYMEVLGPKLSTLKPYDNAQEIIFPPHLKVNHELYSGKPLKFIGRQTTWFRPTSLAELLSLKQEFPNAKVVVGNTDVELEIKQKHKVYPILLAATHVKELSGIFHSEQKLVVGASVTLARLDRELKRCLKILPDFKSRIFVEIVEMLKWFAGNQIRNVASIGGNIMTSSPVGDLNPLLVAAGVKLNLLSKEKGARTVIMDKDFFSGYRKTCLLPEEILVSIEIPYTRQNEHFCGFKQCNRKDDDISIVNAGMFVSLSEKHTVNRLTLAFGGMAATVKLASKTMDKALGRIWDDTLVSDLSESLASEMMLTPGSPGGVEEYRQAMALSFFFKFFLHVQKDLGIQLIEQDMSALGDLDQPEVNSIQVINARDSRAVVTDCVGAPLPHTAALQQSTGEAIYTDDMEPLQGELHLALVFSSRAHADILSIDPTPALAMPGVVDFVSAVDVPGENSLDHKMDNIFAAEKVTCEGQVIAAIVAEDATTARQAANLVKVSYKDRTPLILTIEEAIHHSSYYTPVRRLSVGDVETGLHESEYTLTGEVGINGQDHFYLETMACRAIPGEAGEMEVFCSTQSPEGVQMDVSKALNTAAHKIVVRTKRMGGAFGGKETQPSLSAVPAAVAAHKLKRPIRCVLSREEDMVTTGNRHPYVAKYKVGFTKEGKVTAVDLEVYSNAGNSQDRSLSIMNKTLLQLDACYKFPHMRIVGRCCRTNIISNTAFRGFGGIQASFIADTILEDVAAYLGMNPVKVRELNFYPDGAITHYDMPAGGDSIRRCWEMCLQRSDYQARRAQVDQYNKDNRWKKKGLAVTPARFGVSFILGYMNQGGALVHIYTDGSVLIAHGGVEMGQGLHTKMIQIASETLKIPMSSIHISETMTNTVPNAVDTAASVSTDLYGLAVKMACETLIKRLQPVTDDNPNTSWVQSIQEAYKRLISLTATGHFAYPNLGYDMDKHTGQPFAYFTYGAACSEVQIDCLTGEHKLLRTDIVMDIGDSVNPALDVGQIEGAFTQGYGLMLLEDVKIAPNGTHQTRGPSYYKIPSFGNMPAQMNVHLVPNSPNPQGVFFSRGVGEPPLLLAMSAFFAVKDAVRAARDDTGATGHFRLDSPALPQHIRMACADPIALKFPYAAPNTYVPWTVGF